MASRLKAALGRLKPARETAEAEAAPASFQDGSLLDRRLRERIAAVQHLPLFRRCGDSLMYRLARKLRRRHLAPGEVLTRSGDRCDCIYLLEDGGVQIWGDEEDATSAGLDGPGGVIGDPRVLLDQQDKLWQHNCIARQGRVRECEGKLWLGFR